MTGESREKVLAILKSIAAEVESASEKFPTWPSDPFHALAVIGEEYGELQKAVVQNVYEPDKCVLGEDVRLEAIQTAAMCVRFLVSGENYSAFTVQHVQ